MGLLDKLKESFSGDDKPKNFEVTFVEETMGMTLGPGPSGEPAVTKVKPGGAASKANVRVNDVVKAVNGNPCPSYNNLIAIVDALGRPVVVKFCRLGPDKGDGGGGGGGGGAARSQGEESGPFQLARRKMEELKGPSQPAPLTAEAKAEQREAALKAAESRTKDWNKQRVKGRQASQAKTTNDGVVNNQFEESQNPETRRMVDLAKRQEARTAASMGYNPYEARLMGNTAARAAINGGGEGGGGSSLPSPPPPSSQQAMPSRPPAATPSAVNVDESGELYKIIEKEVDRAIGTVLQQGLPMSLTAVQTMLKMMKNMANKASEDKFKRIRLANANFNSKVGSVDGGIEVMVAAGFYLDTDGKEPVLQHGPCDPTPLRLRVAMDSLTSTERILNDTKGGVQASS